MFDGDNSRFPLTIIPKKRLTLPNKPEAFSDYMPEEVMRMLVLLQFLAEVLM